MLVVGLGEIGKPLYEIIKESGKYDVFGYDTDPSKIVDCSIPSEIDILHICIPCKDMASFVKVVVSYCKMYNPKLLIINSTVPPRTTHFIADVLQSNCLIANSPMFGTHYDKDSMKEQFKFYPRIIGGVNNLSSIKAKCYFSKLGFKTLVVSSPLESEIMKIMETTYAGWMITFFVEFHRLSEYFGANFEDIVKAMKVVCEPTHTKPIWFPSTIEGHCIMQNIDLLLQSYDSGFLHLIKESNDVRKDEVNEKSIKDCIDRIKQLKERTLWEK